MSGKRAIYVAGQAKPLAPCTSPRWRFFSLLLMLSRHACHLGRQYPVTLPSPSHGAPADPTRSYVSGQIAQRPDGTFPETAGEQTRVVMEKIKALVEAGACLAAWRRALTCV